MECRTITTEVVAGDERIETTFRLQCSKDYVGQERVKSILDIYIETVKTRGGSLGHVLFYGPPKLGKTMLVGIIANEMGTSMKVVSGPAAEKPGEMAAIPNDPQEGDILFMGEIHRLDCQVEEVPYSAMEDFAIDIMPGKDSTARSIHLDLPYSILVGAITRVEPLTTPLGDWPGVTQRLRLYAPGELRIIILHSARTLGVEIEAGGAIELARRSRGTPRLVNRLLKRVGDFAQAKYDSVTTREVTGSVLDIMDMNKLGLNQNDRNALLVIIEEFSSGPARLNTLAAVLGEDPGTLEEAYEPYLLTSSLMNRAPRGRTATEIAYRRLGLEM